MSPTDPKPGATPSRGPNPWEAIDAEYRPPSGPDAPGQIPASGFSWRFYHTGDSTATGLLRLTAPLLVVWALASGFVRGLAPWALLGLGLMAFAFLAREPLRRRGLAARAWLLAGLGLGQILLSLSFAYDLGPLWPLIGLYWLGLVVTALATELRGFMRGGGW
jgi:hypothetical protein